jgi:hypothetical protein
VRSGRPAAMRSEWPQTTEVEPSQLGLADSSTTGHRDKGGGVGSECWLGDSSASSPPTSGQSFRSRGVEQRP